MGNRGRRLLFPTISFGLAVDVAAPLLFFGGGSGRQTQALAGCLEHNWLEMPACISVSKINCGLSLNVRASLNVRENH